MAVDLKYLNDQQRDEYKALSDLFNSEGWNFFKSEMLRQRALAVNRAIAADSFAENRIARGELNVLNGILKFEAAYEAQFAEAANQAREAKEAQNSFGEDFG